MFECLRAAQEHAASPTPPCTASQAPAVGATDADEMFVQLCCTEPQAHSEDAGETEKERLRANGWGSSPRLALLSEAARLDDVSSTTAVASAAPWAPQLLCAAALARETVSATAAAVPKDKRRRLVGRSRCSWPSTPLPALDVDALRAEPSLRALLVPQACVRAVLRQQHGQQPRGSACGDGLGDDVRGSLKRHRDAAAPRTLSSVPAPQPQRTSPSSLADSAPAATCTGSGDTLVARGHTPPRPSPSFRFSARAAASAGGASNGLPFARPRSPLPPRSTATTAAAADGLSSVIDVDADGCNGQWRTAPLGATLAQHSTESRAGPDAAPSAVAPAAPAASAAAAAAVRSLRQTSLRLVAADDSVSTPGAHAGAKRYAPGGCHDSTPQRRAFFGSGGGGGDGAAAAGAAAAPLKGFVSATEQLLADVKAGRALPPSLLSHHSPALGLRRGKFQSPFQQPQMSRDGGGGGTAAAESGADASTPAERVRRSIPSPAGGRATAAAGATKESKNGSDEDSDAYPACLLNEDGSVPAILAPLDPKLVTQVAMEILDKGAGSRQIGWEDIAGLEHAKSSVEEAIIWPLRRPDLFVGLRDPPRGLLLFGPPGTGKTMIARAIANRASCTFLNISSSSLMSKWLGDGEKLVRCLFAVATVKQPSVIFIDEIDSLLSMRGEGEMDSVRRVKTEFLVQLDGVATDRDDRVLLIGATNRPDELDEAARRRMEKRLYIPLPDPGARQTLIDRLLSTLSSSLGSAKESGEEAAHAGTLAGAAHCLTADDLAHVVRCTDGYSGADLKHLCREAAMGPLREMTARQLGEIDSRDLRPIDRRDFKQALRRIKPSVGVAEVQRYTAWNEQFGSFTDGTNDDDDDEEEDEDGHRTGERADAQEAH